MKSQKNTHLTIDEVRSIFGRDYQFIQSILETNVYCSHCKSPYNTGMSVDFIMLNSINDMVFHGLCLKCGNKVARYIECGENSEYVTQINKLKSKRSISIN